MTARTIKKDWLESELLASCSDTARVLSVSLMILADSKGIGRGSLAYLTSKTWRYREICQKGAEGALKELVDIGFVEVHDIEGQAYFELCEGAV